MKRQQLVALSLFAALTATAATTTYTSTGWVTGVPVMGVWCTNALGQVSLRSLVHTARVQSTDPRMSGDRLITVDGGYNADGTATLQGSSYQQVGTWDAQTNFIPSGGVWEITYEGVMQTNNSLLLHLVGYGSGGAIDGLRVDETLTRAATANILDPTVPYLYTGAIKAPPLSTNLLRAAFGEPLVGWTFYGPPGSYSYTVADGGLRVTGDWPGVITRNVVDSYTFGVPPGTWSLADGQTVEGRVDLLNQSPSVTAARLILGTDSGFYSAFKGRDFIAVGKWSANLPWGPLTMFFYEKVQTPDTNAVLALELMRTSPNVVITVRVLDKANPESVLYERSVVDTPSADPSLTAAELLTLSGMNLTLAADLPGPPFISGSVGVGVFQYNDGTQPAAVITYENLELGKFETPRLAIERAARLTWFAPAGVNYGVEGAPTVQGPWSRVQETEIPGMNQMTIPASARASFFRLREAP